jgi:hypothetical protein
MMTTTDKMPNNGRKLSTISSTPKPFLRRSHIQSSFNPNEWIHNINFMNKYQYDKIIMMEDIC